jgi:hypothetical protein
VPLKTWTGSEKAPAPEEVEDFMMMEEGFDTPVEEFMIEVEKMEAEKAF